MRVMEHFKPNQQPERAYIAFSGYVYLEKIDIFISKVNVGCWKVSFFDV